MRDAVQQLIALFDRAASTGLDSAAWTGVARAGKTLADGLRSEALRTAAGQTGFVSAAGGLLTQAVDARGGCAEVLSAQTELARVVGNLCYEHDPNRQLVLDAGVPLALAQLLSHTLEVLPEGEEVHVGGQRRLSVEELKFVRATTGAFLNASLKFDPMRRHLSRREILSPLVALLDARTTAGKATSPIYVVGCWAREVGEGEGVDELEDRLQIGQMAAGWAANVLEDVLGESKTAFPPSGILSLSSIVLAVSSQSSPSSLPAHVSPDDATDYLDTDIELLTIASSLLESLAQDLPSAASALAFSTSSPSLPYPDCTLLHQLLTFIAHAKMPAYWTFAASDDPARANKAFAAVKAAVVRAVVEAPNNDEVMERLWSETRGRDGQEGTAKSWLVEMLVRWLEEAQDEGREDMLIAAAHVLAGLGRKDEHTLSLVHDYALAEPLARIVSERVNGAIGRTGRPGETTQILFGVVSLLRHLAIPAANRDVLGKTGVISPAAELLRRELDMVQPLQGAVIGLLKHLVTGNISNALAVLGSPPTSSDSPSTTPLDSLLALISRTDELRLRAEGTRVLVNLARTLFSLPQCATSHDDDALAAQVAQGRDRLVRRDVGDAMGELVRASEKFPILVNEGVVGLTLLAGSGREGASLVLASLLHPPSRTAPPTAPEPDPLDVAASSASITSLSTLPPPPAPVPATDDAPSTAAAMLARWLSLAPTLAQQPPPSQALLRPEMLANAASLLHAVVLGGAAAASSTDVEALKEVVQGPLEAAGPALDGAAGEAVRRAAEAMASVAGQ
ncbi:hypothetical protein JCM8208_004976 [Rhodotorula glutinis]